MNRRDFMKGILAAGMAPAIVRAESLMRINSRPVSLHEHEGLMIGPGGPQLVLHTDWGPIARIALEPYTKSDGTVAYTATESYTARERVVIERCEFVDGHGMAVDLKHNLHDGRQILLPDSTLSFMNLHLHNG